MTTCPKCKAANPDDVNRCQSCNAMLPIKLGSASQELFEREGLRPTHTGMRCPQCQAVNPYTRIKCERCGSPLIQQERRGGLLQAWPYLAIGVVVLLVVFLVLRGA